MFLWASTTALALVSEEGGGYSPIQFDPNVFFWTILVFLVVMFLLGKFAWRPLLGALAERENRITGALQEAERAREEAKKMAADFDAKVREAQREASRITEEARTNGERLATEIESAARKRADQMVERARAEIQMAQRQAVEEVRRTSVELALAATEEVLKKNVDDGENRRLASNVIQMMSDRQQGTGS